MGNRRTYLYLDMLYTQQQVRPICLRALSYLFIKQILFICLLFISCLYSTYSLADSTHTKKATVDLTPEEQAWRAKHPVFKVVAFPLEPYIIEKEGEVSGYMTELLRAVSSKVNLTPQFSYHEIANEAFTVVQSGKVEASMGIIHTPERAQHLTFSPETIPLNLAIFSRKSSQSMSSLDSLKGKRIASYHGYTLLALTKKQLPDAEIVLANDAVGMLQLVATGKADAAIQELHTGQYMLRNNYINNLEVKGYATFKGIKAAQGHSYVVNKAYPLLQSILDKGYKALTEREKRQLWDKWFDKTKPGIRQGTQFSAKEKAWLAAHPVMRIGIDADYAPYSFRDKEGQYRGIAVEFSNYLSQRLGVSMEIVPNLSWPEIVDRLRERKLDVVATLAHRPEREAFANFTEIYLPTPLVIMRRSEDSSVSSEADLKGRTVAIVEGYSSSARILEEHPDVKPLKVKTAKDGLFAVSTGKADAYVGVIGINLYLVNKLGITNLEVASLYGSGENGQRFGVRKDWPELATILDKALKAMPEGRKRKIFENWLPTMTSRLAIIGKAEPLVELSLTEEEKAWLAENPVVRLGNSVDWPPFGFIKKDGVYSGIAADYFSVIEKILGITFEPAKLSSWKETVDAARKAEVDLLDAVVPTPQRRGFLTFTKPYISYPVVLFAHKNIDYIANMSVLNGQRVTVIAGSALHDILINNHPEFEIVAAENAKAGLLAVEKREASAFIGNLPTASQVMSREGIINLKVAGETPYRYDLTIGINKNKPILASLIQKALDSIPEEKHNEIYRKWMSVTFEHDVNYALFIKLFVLTTFIFIVIFIWYRQHQIKKITLEVASRKKIEESLFKSEHYNRMLFEKSPVGLALCHMNGELVDINLGFAAILGRTVEETKALSYWDITPEKYAQQEQQQLSELEKTGRYGPYEKEYIHKDGYLVPVRLSGQILEREGTKYIWSSVEDITEHKKADQALRKSEKDLKAIFDNMQDAFYRADMDGRIIMLSPSAETLMQYTLEELMGQKLAGYYVDPDGRKKFLKALEEEGGNVQGFEAAVRVKDGSQIWVSTNAHYFYDDEGNINGVEGTIRDISARKKAEENLKNSERGLSEAQHITHMGSWEWDIINNEITWSDELCRIYGLESGQIEPSFEYFLSLLNEDTKIVVTDSVDKALAGKAEYNNEFQITLKNGKERIVSAQGIVIRDQDGKPVQMIGTTQDITERKQAEYEKEQLQRELQQSQKMDALGKLTGGIAHEYNNMLAIMIGFSELLKTSLKEQPKLFKYAKEIQYAGNRAAKLTSKLLTFSRQKTPEAKSINLNTLLHKQQHMLEKTLTVRINLKLNLQENLWNVWLDEGDMEDAIINMSINAMHAIEGSGQLTVQTSNQQLNQVDAESLGLMSGDYVLLSFTDTGCGMNEETKEKIFDPFFTTKGLEEGTGLGLSMVYGFVQNSSGTIKVDSESGQGSQFTFYFPRYHGASGDQQSGKENHSEDDFIGNKTILVVDDEPALLDLTYEILSEHGYKVICAESAKAALNILEHESIDILISDILMPEMDGYQLAAIVKEKYPSIKIQLASGFTDERNMGMDDEHLQKNLLHKPFSQDAVLQRIRELCDED